MTQVLTSFLAMILVMIFSINFYEAKLQTDRELFSAEMEVMGHAVATDVMAHIAAQPYDEKTADGTVSESQGSEADLSPSYSFGTNQKFEDCDDVDDFHEMQTHLVEFVSASEGPTGVVFGVRAKVAYVDDDGNESAAPTFTKRVTLTVTGPTAPDGRSYLFSPIQYARLVVPEWY